MLTPVQTELLSYLNRQYNFRGASSAEKEKLASLARPGIYAQGDFLFQEGDPVEYLFFLLEGGVNLHCWKKNETRKMWANITAPNMICGYEMYRWNRLHTENTLCLGKTRVAKISLDDYFAHVVTTPGLAAAMADYMAFIIEERTQDIMCVSVEDKLNLYFRRQKDLFRRWVVENGLVKLYRDHFYDQIGEMVGLTRETVNRELKKMEKAGRIRLEKDFITILDQEIIS